MPRRRRPPVKALFSLTPEIVAGLTRVEHLLKRKRVPEALDELEDLDERFPGQPEIMAQLLALYGETEDFRGCERLCTRLLELTPDDPDLLLPLAAAYLGRARFALALDTLRRFLRLYPNHEEAPAARETVEMIEAELPAILPELGLTMEDGLELAEQHERMQSLMDRGHFAEAARIGERLLRRKPDFIPVLNNLSLVYAFEGRLPPAIAHAERVLALQPENYHALANLVRYHIQRGQFEQARAAAEALRQAPDLAPDALVKKAQAFSHLGDDEAVLALLPQSRRKDPADAWDEAYLLHYAGVAAARLGREAEARRHWQRAVKLAPGLPLPAVQLEELRKPVGERFAPWAFGLEDWVPRRTVQDLLEILQGAGTSEKGEAQAMQRCLREHPELPALVPALLDRGDPMGVQLAVMVASVARTPPLLEALRDFATGQRGPDQGRFQAAQVVSREGLIPSGPVEMWIQGQWREVLLLGFEIHDEQSSPHPPRVQKLVEQAHEAFYDGDYAEAERLFRHAHELAPEAPDLLNNLAAMYLAQGRTAEHREIVLPLFERHPDYFFVRVAIANLAIEDEDLDRAQELLEPLLQQRRLHVSEFRALCQAQIRLLEARDEIDGAEQWLGMWEGADPDNPDIGKWRKRLGARALLSKLPVRRKRR